MVMNERAQLKEKVAVAFGEEIAKLPTNLQTDLVDDMVTAFESRLNIFKKATVA